MFEIVLFQPQIPQNTGNIVRSCSVTGAKLTLIPPLGFSTASRHLKRAGLDYWEGVNVEIKEDLDALLEEDVPFLLFTSKGESSFWDFPYVPGMRLIFGSETAGLPEAVTTKHKKRCARIPMREGARCLNLATSVGIALYEGLSCLRKTASDERLELGTIL